MSAIDWPLTVKILRGNSKIARDILAMFIRELPQAQHDVQQAWEQKDFKALYEHLHKLHGGCSYCGVPEFKETVEKFCEALRQKAPTEIYIAFMEKFKTESQLVLADYRPEEYKDIA